MNESTLGYVFSNGTLTLTLGWEIFTVHEDDFNYGKVWEALDRLPDEGEETIIEEIKFLLTPTAVPLDVEIPHYDTSDFQVDRYGHVFVKGTLVDDPITRKISEIHRSRGSYAPLVAFMNKLAKNPNPEVRDQLFNFLNVSGFPLTLEGDFLGYKGVKRDLWDVYTGWTFQYTAGAVISMPRDAVCDDPDQGCAPGIHVGSFDYANGFSEVVVLVQVDPEHVVSVPTDYNFQKLRACELRVARVIPLAKKLARPVYTDADLDVEDEDEWFEDEEEELTTYTVPVAHMSRDALCTYAGSTEFFQSAAEARFMGKAFVRNVLEHESFDFPKVRKRDIRKFLARRNVAYRNKETLDQLIARCL